MKIEDIKLIKDFLNVTEEMFTYSPVDSERRFIYCEVMESGVVITYLFYLCYGSYKFSYKDYLNIVKKIEQDDDKTSFFTSVFIFDDLYEETSQYNQEYYDKRKKAIDKKILHDLFERKQSIYKNAGMITLCVEEKGINYLEYFFGLDNDKKNLNGYIYNLSYFELEKLFNVKGRDLFRENVRFGLLQNNTTRKKLVNSFKKYLKVGVFEYLLNNDFGFSLEEIRENLELGIDDLSQFEPESFWFKHNGVTVFVLDEKIDRRNDTIKFNACKASIINGAQTITNLYSTKNEILQETEQLLKNDFKSILEEKNIREDYQVKNFVKNILDEICKSIYIKTIFIEGDGAYIKQISDGLNTQIPISEADVLANSDLVEELNKKLRHKKIKIIKAGEFKEKNGITVLDFAKYYKIIQGNPGTSKNLNKNNVNSILKEANKKSDLAREMHIVLEADEWWQGNAAFYLKNDKEKNEDEYNILRYGKNYFESYVFFRNPTNLDEDSFSSLCLEFIRDSKNAKTKKTMAEFKRDQLFIEIQEEYTKFNNSKIPEGKSAIENIKSNLVQYLNENVKSNYHNNSLISSFLGNHHIALDSFRTIVVNKKDGKLLPKEAFAFTAATFRELYENFSSNDEVLDYDDSIFCTEVKKEFSVFVIEKVREEIVDIYYWDCFSFKDYSEEAKQVYNETVAAFENGDENLFVKQSDKKRFHIRPKAINADDTFQFSNGKEITKRTFWANKETVSDIISNLLSDDNL